MEDLRGNQSLKHKGNVMLVGALGIKFLEERSRLGLDLGAALRESGGGLGLDVGILTPGVALSLLGL